MGLLCTLNIDLKRSKSVWTVMLLNFSYYNGEHVISVSVAFLTYE